MNINGNKEDHWRYLKKCRASYTSGQINVRDMKKGCEQVCSIQRVVLRAGSDKNAFSFGGTKDERSGRESEQCDSRVFFYTSPDHFVHHWINASQGSVRIKNVADSLFRMRSV